MESNRLKNFYDYLNQNIMIYDGGMGTSLQSQQLSSNDFNGKDGCSEALNLYCPQAVEKVHKDFIEAGCSVIETNTFSATAHCLKQYELSSEVEQINKVAVEIARNAIKTAKSNKQIFIAGSVGPGSLLPSLGNITFDELKRNYSQQISILLDEEVDILQIETCQDLLQVKAALIAASELFESGKTRCPVVVSVTLEATGTMLTGSSSDAIATTLKPFDFIDAIGINCATGPLEMVRHVAHLSECWPRKLAVMPNAGLPEVVDGKPVYSMSPDEFASYMYDFVTKFGVDIVGGCCGTSAEHIRAVAQKLSLIRPAKRSIKSLTQASSTFSSVSLKQNPPPTMIAERTNANGAKAFRDMLQKEDYEGMAAMARQQTKGGAHLLDLSVAFAGRDEVEDIKKLVPLIASRVDLPLVIDSTSPDAIEQALKLHGGRCIINSVNLEDGKDKLLKIAYLAKKYGAALICLAIDESGMAKTSDKKLEIIEKIHSILTTEFNFAEEDLIFDPLTFTLASGDTDSHNSASETLKAIKEICQKFSKSSTVLGVSNVSYGLDVNARETLNSVFLDEAIAHGLTCAIVNPSGIIPSYSINEELRQAALNLIYGKSTDGSDLKKYMELFSEKNVKTVVKEKINITPKESLHSFILEGESDRLKPVIETLLENIKPQEIINSIILPAMSKVGELFSKGSLQLPFVLQSAETVKKAVAIIEPHIKAFERTAETGMVLATVAGDVHDIGKNLVAIMLQNNGYKVVDAGIRVDIDTMIRKAQENKLNIIGMSGLLVKSTIIMKENLEELNRREFLPDVIVGGAALTQDYVENQLKPAYKGRVFYSKDAVEAVSIMKTITCSN